MCTRQQHVIFSHLTIIDTTFTSRNRFCNTVHDFFIHIIRLITQVIIEVLNVLVWQALHEVELLDIATALKILMSDEGLVSFIKQEFVVFAKFIAGYHYSYFIEYL